MLHIFFFPTFAPMKYGYTLGIFFSVALAMSFPQWFQGIGDFSYKRLIIPLLQIIMFGMGATMSFRDFTDVLRMPRAVLVGIVAQFSIMPLVAVGLTKLFQFPPEIAAGIILVGSVPCGLASNVMSYIAGANVALSVTLTACATLLAPLLTPFLMKTLGGQLVDVSFWKMMIDITNMIILPVAAGFAVNYFFKKYVFLIHKVMPVVSMLAIAVIITIITAAGRDSLMQVGGRLVFACLLHNLSGYLLGFWSARLAGLDERSCRTVAIEVGLQNAGLASGLALSMGKVATVGLAPAVFGPLMNASGSILASWWKSKAVSAGESNEQTKAAE
jgi:bile acid:Na+ symporter, BASS family